MNVEELKRKIKSEVDEMVENDHRFLCQIITLIKKHRERSVEQ